jgi:hypothetical protein
MANLNHLFSKKTLMQKIEAELAALTSRATLLNTKRKAAQSTLDGAVEARQKMLLTGNLDDSKASLALQAKVDTATSALAGFDTAITAQAALVADAEARLAAERLDADRKVGSDLLATQVAVIDQLLGPWLESSRNLASAFEEIHWRFECAQVGGFIRNAAGEVENANLMTAPDLHRSIKSIRDGGLAIPRVPNAVVVPAPAAKQPTTRHVFSVHNVSWTDETGLRVQAAGFECDLPPACAERGLKSGALALIGSTAHRTLAGTRPISNPAPERCQNLDGNDGHGTEPKAAAPQPQHEVIKHSGFVETIGAPRLMRVGGTS